MHSVIHSLVQVKSHATLMNQTLKRKTSTTISPEKLVLIVKISEFMVRSLTQVQVKSHASLTNHTLN